MITSRSNQTLKRVRKLLSSAAERRKTGLFVAEGVRLCSEVPTELIEEILISEEAADTGLSGLSSAEIVEKGLFRELSDTVNPQGVMAVVRKPRFEKPDFSDRKKILLLDGIRDPGNLGTMLRTAEAAGVGAVFLSPDCVDLYNPKVVRSTMGSIFRVPTYCSELPTVIGQLKKQGRSVYATCLDADRSFREVPLAEAAIVIGSEANGVSQEVLSAVPGRIRIPMEGNVESLNAAVAAAILMFC